MSPAADPRLAKLEASPAFDARWYAETHPDVAASRMGPAEHYLWVGALMDRDPSPGLDALFHRLACRDCREPGAVPALCRHAHGSPPEAWTDPEQVLMAASTVAELKGSAAGAALAEAHLPPDLVHTTHVLGANAELERGDEDGWTRRTNRYLAHAGGLEVALRPGPEPAFARLAPAREPRPITGGPLVSVLMPAWNAEATVATAARSILDQSWRNLELIVVDDASTDGTWDVLREVAASDDRVRLSRSVRNTGPYVAKNLALRLARGAWVTGHDADDWAHPERIALHFRAATDAGGGTPLRASAPYMLRVQPDGHFSFLSDINHFSFDGAARRCSVATLFQADLLRRRLGAWDSVRFDADSEMIARTVGAIGDEFRLLRHVSTFCLDLPTSLTNLPGIGLSRGSVKGQVRRRYKEAWRIDHEARAETGDFMLPFPQRHRCVAAPPEMLVPLADIMRNLEEPDASSARAERATGVVGAAPTSG